MTQYQIQPGHLVGRSPAGSLVDLDSTDEQTTALLALGAISSTIVPSLNPATPPDHEAFFWALQGSTEYQSIQPVAYQNPVILQALDSARLLFVAPNVLDSTLEWGLQTLLDAIRATTADHSLEADEIASAINNLAAASYVPITVT